ncbi:Hypothetical predicted protein [Olea europaea subsp. europaea]|uniref:Uncharacterized protein n=1 Tax=Olea europaea subsp. europaea TaxID=158383 RepID=A0A8S0UJW4_OLEEU|nr:Hypothetical predicted protein [Olea europaea subsp. europaea]
MRREHVKPMCQSMLLQRIDKPLSLVKLQLVSIAANGGDLCHITSVFRALHIILMNVEKLMKMAGSSSSSLTLKLKLILLATLELLVALLRTKNCKTFFPKLFISWASITWRI